MNKENTLSLGSLFDGSGAFPLGGLIAGITPLWSSEVEPFPVRVTTKRFPDMKHSESYEAEPDYIVRRLTPTECARLQGFPDWWCSGLETAEPTQEDIAYWSEVFETHRRLMGTSSKPKTESQIIKWLQNPHSDSAEYKMWGNGCALPNVVFVLSGIVWANTEV